MSKKRLAISWSGLRRWEECRQKHLRVIQGKSIATIDGRVFLPGTVADRIMRAWLESDDPQPGQMEAMVPEFMDRYTKPPAEGESEPDGRYAIIRWRGNRERDRALVTNFVTEVVRDLEPILLKLVVPHEYQPEMRFRTTIQIPYLDGRMTSIDLIGAMDIVTRLLYPMLGLNTEDWVSYDLKATKDPKYMSKTAGQAIFYDIGLGHFIGDTSQPKLFGFIAPAIPEKVVWVRITNDDRRMMMARIIAMAQGMWKQDWDPKESDAGCQWCEVQHACTKWAVEVDRDAAGRNRASFQKAATKRSL